MEYFFVVQSTDRVTGYQPSAVQTNVNDLNDKRIMLNNDNKNHRHQLQKNQKKKTTKIIFKTNASINEIETKLSANSIFDQKINRNKKKVGNIYHEVLSHTSRSTI